MTIKPNEWYRVKETTQYCFVQRIPSMTNPQVSVPRADENTRGFEVALVWYAAADEARRKWTKRVMVMELRKALSLLREPTKTDLRTIGRLKAVAHTIPISSAGRDGEFTMGL